MPEPIVLERIASWERAGVIDQATAERLRVLEAGEANPPTPDLVVSDAGSPSAWLPAWLGPGFTASEIFAYLGGIFVLLAWNVMVNTTFTMQGTLIGLATIGAGGVLAGVGRYLGPGSDRMRRAAGLAFLAATAHIGVGVATLLHAVRFGWVGIDAASALVGGILALLAAVAFRELRPGLSTQLGVALAAAGLAAAFPSWVEPVLFGGTIDEFGAMRLAPERALVRVLFTLGWWWLATAGMAVLVLPPLFRGARESARASLGRLAVGLTAVLGTFMAIQQRYPWDYLGEGGELVVAAWLGAAVVVGVSVVLAVLGLIRGATAYVWPAAFGVWLGLTYLNTEYVAEGVGLGTALLVEGLILFGVALAARRLGDRIGQAGEPLLPATAPPPAEAGSS